MLNIFLGINIDAALWHAFTSSTKQQGNRPEVPDYLLVITSGKNHVVEHLVSFEPLAEYYNTQVFSLDK